MVAMTSTSATTTAPDTRRPSPSGPVPGPTGRRPAGWAALSIAATYLVGLVAFGAWLGPEGWAEGTPAEQVDVLLAHGGALLALDTLLYLFGGAALVVLVLGTHDLLRPVPDLLRRTATAFGLLWSGLLFAAGLVGVVGQQVVVDLHATEPERATTAWVAVRAVHDGLGGGVEVVGALWVLLLAIAGPRSAVTGRALGRVGVVVAAAGLLTIVPALEPLTAVFGLGAMAWFAWLGAVLLRRRSPRI
jgi:hypothetical protein